MCVSFWGNISRIHKQLPRLLKPPTYVCLHWHSRRSMMSQQRSKEAYPIDFDSVSHQHHMLASFGSDLDLSLTLPETS